MRKRICLLIAVICILLIAILFMSDGFKPFSKLAPQDISYIEVIYDSDKELTSSDPEQLDTFTKALNTIEIRYTALPGDNLLCGVKVNLKSEDIITIYLYSDAITIDNKTYALSSKLASDVVNTLKIS